MIPVLTIGRRRPTESDRRCLIDIREDLHRPTEANLRIELRDPDLGAPEPIESEARYPEEPQGANHSDLHTNN